MPIQVTMRRSLFQGGAPRLAGQTYTEADDVATDWLQRGWAVIGAAPGAQLAAVLAAPARNSGNPTLAVFSNAQGAQIIGVKPLAITAGDVIVVAWSTTEADSAALGSLIDTVCDDLELVTPTGVFAPNTRIITATTEQHAAVWDGSERIKSLAAVACRLGAGTGATAQRVLLDLTL